MTGLALDEHGRIYIADNGGGKIWRLDPSSGEMVLIVLHSPSVEIGAWNRYHLGRKR